MDNAVKEHGTTRPAQYLNRELSQLKLFWRVLALAQDPDVPLLERLRYLTISTSILDEFFEIRVAGLKQQVALSVGPSGPEDLSPQDIFHRVSDETHRLVDEQYRVLNDDLLPALDREEIRIFRRSVWDEKQREWVARYFRDEVFPVLTPIGLDPAHPFPRIVNKSLNFIVSLKGKDAFGRTSRGAVVQAPRVLPRLIRIPPEISGGPNEFVMLSSVIHDQVNELFPGMKVKGCAQFRVTRDSDLWIDEEEVDDLMSALKGELMSRPFGGETRLEVADNCTDEMQQFLLEHFDLSPHDMYRVHGPVNLHRLSVLYDLVDLPDLKFRPFTQSMPAQFAHGSNPFDVIRKSDVLLHHPFQSLGPVVELLRAAAQDPNVLAIKQTVYRSGATSPLSEALIEAARNGKEVTAVVELRARFDEAENIDLATRLQEAGAKVAYGIVGYKAHAKMLLIVRREGDMLRRYVHLGTGNYHMGNTRAYTDFGLLTCDADFGEDVHRVFQQLTGLGKVTKLKKLLQSPFTLHKRLLEHVRAETKAALDGRKARIIAKMNALIEPQIIRALYDASQAGVKVDLVVRGICCLVPGVPGLSENIHVRSVLGRFLEHTRVFYFHADGDEVILCASADWMQRNFFQRVEVGFPVESRKLRRRVIEEGLVPYLDDNTNSWFMQPDGSYVRGDPGDEPPFTAQSHLLDLLGEETGPHEPFTKPQ